MPTTIDRLTFALLLLVSVLLPPAYAGARPWLCLPPIFDGGQRLHERPTAQVFWLEPLLRQHELCWRTATDPHEMRVALVGSSAAYGFPLSADETVGGLLNQHFADGKISAHVFNLAFVHPYQLRDAVILHEALPYEPDVILYPMTLADFRHTAPVPFPTYSRFFEANAHTVRAMTATPPPGLEEPLGIYRQWLDDTQTAPQVWEVLREAGLFVRLTIRRAAIRMATLLNAPPPPSNVQTGGRQTDYDCNLTTATSTGDFRDWKEWDVLAYLEELQRTRNIRVLLVHWPISHDPVGDCYSVRYTNANVADFREWIAQESHARSLRYLDLHDAVPNDLFLDSLHLSAAGHRRVSAAISRELDALVAETPQQRSRPR